MKKETRICQNCGKEFTIEPEDFAFYEKIKVPAPTWCPECRMIRRMMFRNERSLYKRKCDATGKDIISMYSPDKPFKVYDQKYWWSDKWDPMDYGRDCDWNKPFFEQFRELMLAVPRINLMSKNSINSDYCNNVSNHKNCYLETAGYGSENVLYSHTSAFCKDCSDLFIVNNSERCYQLLDSSHCYNVVFSRYCENCLDSAFLFDCKNCQNCFGCIGLRNKQYYIFNRPYSKQEYFEKIKNFDLMSFKVVSEIQNKIKDFYLKYPRVFAKITKSYDVSGDNIRNSKNCHNCFDIGMSSEFSFGVNNGKHLLICGWCTEDSYDCMQLGNASLCYEVIGGSGDYLNRFSYVSWNNRDIYYSDNCHNCSNLFGCLGLRNKQYCILNKQYTKEEYFKMVEKIKKHMNDMPYIDKKGRVYKYGEFFPPELSPFAYNETIAQEYFPLTKEEAIEKGYSWKDSEQRNIKPDIYTKDLPDNIKDVKDDIVNKVIQCAHAKVKEDGTLEAACQEQCTTGFKIIPQELEFYRKMNLPLPRLCPNCRHYQRIKQRNPLKLWKRQCMCGGKKSTNGVYTNTAKHFHGQDRCPNEFYTTYSPERPEIVYCEKCYQDEVT